MGKSTVVEHFLNRLMGERRAVILTGRCYDRESMPYKAFDGVIDSLTRYLRTLPASEVKALLPADVLTIARLFPVLQRVGEIENAPPLAFDIPDPLELRRRAIAALRELLGRLATHVPLVVHIDDLHWADADSIALGQVLLRRPGAPAPAHHELPQRGARIEVLPAIAPCDGAGQPEPARAGRRPPHR